MSYEQSTVIYECERIQYKYTWKCFVELEDLYTETFMTAIGMPSISSIIFSRG